MKLDAHQTIIFNEKCDECQAKAMEVWRNTIPLDTVPDWVCDHKRELHYCTFKYEPQERTMLEYCLETYNGFLYLCNGEYMSRVNYCPSCGYKARVPKD